MQLDILSLVFILLLGIWSIFGLLLYMHMHADFSSFWKGLIATFFFGPIAVAIYLGVGVFELLERIIKWAEEKDAK
jgi:uncharacterized membrane protein (DUF2068 family)